MHSVTAFLLSTPVPPSIGLMDVARHAPAQTLRLSLPMQHPIESWSDFTDESPGHIDFKVPTLSIGPSAELQVVRCASCRAAPLRRSRGCGDDLTTPPFSSHHRCGRRQTRRPAWRIVRVATSWCALTRQTCHRSRRLAPESTGLAVQAATRCSSAWRLTVHMYL